MKAFHCALFLLALLFLFALESSAQKIQREGQDYALFFAVSDYEDGTLPKLPNSITDAIKIAGVLEKNYDFKTEILENPTLDEIDDKLHEYQDNFLNNIFDRKGQLFIFFSGHGVKDYDNGYFLPVDANPERLLRTALAYDTWRPLISEIAAQHILVAVDACYSVTFDPSWQSKANPRFKRIGEMSEDDRIVANHKAYKNRVFFTADARENTVPGRSNFARKLYEGLLFYRNEDVPFVTSSELYGTFVKKAQPSPRAGHFEGDQAESSFLFFPKNENTIDPNQFSAREKDMAAYEAIRNAPSLSKCDQYLQDFPYGAFRGEVYDIQLKLQEDQDWRFAQLKQDGSVYLSKYPQGRYAAAARKLNAVEEQTKLNIRFDRQAQLHLVKENETLHSIARKYKTTVSRLADANNLHPEEVLLPGQSIFIK